MNEITFRVDEADAVAAFHRAPDVMKRHVGPAVKAGAKRVADAAQAKAAERNVTAGLSGSIHPERVDDLTWRAVTGKAYARYVEEGTGTFAGQARYYPNPDALLDYLKTTPGSRGFKWAKPGSKKRAGQGKELERRAKAWAWSIYTAGGTKPSPYMKPAAEESRDGVLDLMRQAVNAGVAEVFGVR